MKVKNIYTSVACNRTPKSADWGTNGLIVFAAQNAVAIFDPKYKGYSAKIIHTFIQHEARVNTVKWVRSGEQNEHEFRILSGSDDGKAIFWDIKNLENPDFHILHGHESGVNVIDYVYVEGRLMIATGSTDSKLCVWSFNEDKNEFYCFQKINLKNGFCLSIAFTIFPKTQQLLLCYAGDDDNISLLTGKPNFEEHNKNEEQGNESNEGQLKLIHTLKGHEDWVRDLDFIEDENEDLLLASSSQDGFVRLWRISHRPNEKLKSITNCSFGDGSDKEIQLEEKIIKITSKSGKEEICFAVSLESVLNGHENWVFGVNWNKSSEGLRLLSSSIDKTLIIWSCTEDGIWMENVRVGEVGGNGLGFYGGRFAPDGKSILGHGYQGSFHIWNQSKEDPVTWNPEIVIGGHFSGVCDISWEKDTGNYLLSVSTDQTTRIHAPWITDSSAVKNESEFTWHEIARPQVHGYDMKCITSLSRYTFASGGEEKIVRVFHAPGNFIENFRRICRIDKDEEGDNILKNMPTGASVPSLGLSNKAVYDNDTSENVKQVKDEYPEYYFTPLTLVAPPQEETLMQNTLWPEIQKLYGHGFEMFALCSSPDGKLLASSCKAASFEHAQIILWNTSTWKQIQKLSSHKLTITDMKFSPDSNYLLSVSRDRRWTLFKRKDDTGMEFELFTATDQSNGVHKRIIWSCDWSHDSKYFVTCSRDGKIAVWTPHSETPKCVNSIDLKDASIMAVAFAKDYFSSQEENYLLAAGFEDGHIELYTFKQSLEKHFTMNKNCAHHYPVTKLMFRPGCKRFQLASCGEDNFVRISEISA